MTIESGTRLGPYEIVALIGAGLSVFSRFTAPR
jgi:hypothetical protein